MKRTIAVVVLFATLGGGAAGADPKDTVTSIGRNSHHFTLKLDAYDWVKGTWQGNANFTISACPQPTCFHLSGSLVLPENPSTYIYEGSFPVPGQPCDLRFEEVPRDGMDSTDYRVTPKSRDAAGRGCATLPAGLPGIYKAD
jgi:hypothetical protein